MAKTFFNLTGPYEGLRARRLRQFGRLVLYQIINDPPPYWFVTVKNFRVEIDNPLMGVSWGNGNWRFVRLADAEKKFEELATVPEYRKAAKEAQNRAAKISELLRQYRKSGKITLFEKSSQKLYAMDAKEGGTE